MLGALVLPTPGPELMLEMVLLAATPLQAHTQHPVLTQALERPLELAVAAVAAALMAAAVLAVAAAAVHQDVLALYAPAVVVRLVAQAELDTNSLHKT